MLVDDERVTCITQQHTFSFPHATSTRETPCKRNAEQRTQKNTNPTTTHFRGGFKTGTGSRRATSRVPVPVLKCALERALRFGAHCIGDLQNVSGLSGAQLE
jgi:hypothetical protein